MFPRLHVSNVSNNSGDLSVSKQLRSVVKYRGTRSLVKATKIFLRESQIHVELMESTLIASACGSIKYIFFYVQEKVFKQTCS